jgi:pimeloyl-ACP methyl ester carboxylesterase
MEGTVSRGRGGLSRALNLRRAFMPLSAAIIVACDHDVPTGLKPVNAPPASVVEIASPATSAYDYGINRNDSWVEQTQTVAETTTVTASEPFDDPGTGQPTYGTTVGTEPQTVNVSAGYGYDGQPRITTGFQQSSREETVWLQRVTDVTIDTRPDGSVTQPFPYDPMSELGSLQGAYMDIGPGGGGAGTGGTCTQITGCDAWLKAQDSTLIAPFGGSGPVLRTMRGARRRVITRPGRNLVRVEETLSPIESGSAGLLNLQTTTSAARDEDSKTERRLTRDYEKQDGEWRLKHTLNETFVDTPDKTMRFAMHLTIAQSRVHRNKEKDAERVKAAHPTTVPVSAPVSLAFGTSNESCDPLTAIIPCSTDPTPTGPTEPLHVDATMVVDADYTRSLGRSGPPIVMQHGFVSDGRTWNRMEYWLARDLSISGVYRFTTPWSATYENQAGSLHGKIAQQLGNRASILIGHSNGGMISRYLGRHPDAWNIYPNANISAVITVGTPHYGAPLAKHAQSVNRLFRWGGTSGLLLCRWTQTAGCNSFGNISSSTLGNIYTALTSNVPVLGEMQPSSSYHTAFNGEPEGFKRFGISSHIWTRWMPWRVYGDAYCYPESGCGGAAQVRKIDRIYKRDVACVVIGALFGRWDAALRCAADGVFIRATDEIYRRYVDFAGDGIVPAWSQRYPFIADQDRYIVDNGPSHVGETSSSRVGNKIETVLLQKLLVAGRVGLAP